MRVPDEYYGVFVVHVGPQIRAMYTDPDEALAHLRRSIVDHAELVEFCHGLRSFAQKCYDRGTGNQVFLTHAECQRELERVEAWVSAWKKGRK